MLFAPFLDERVINVVGGIPVKALCDPLKIGLAVDGRWSTFRMFY